MAYASLLGGLALANAGLGVVHGFAAPVGGMFEAPHGAVCAAILPYGVAANLQALRSRAPGHEALARYRTIASILTGNAAAEPEDAVDWLLELGRDLGIVGLAAYGVGAGDSAEIVRKAAVASSMKANPVVLSDEELASVLESAVG
jgi:alcohol dehydrogenase class IV